MLCFVGAQDPTLKRKIHVLLEQKVQNHTNCKRSLRKHLTFLSVWPTHVTLMSFLLRVFVTVHVLQKIRIRWVCAFKL